MALCADPFSPATAKMLRDEAIRLKFLREADADEVDISRSSDGNVYVKIVRNKPCRVGMNFYLEAYELDHDSAITSMARRAGEELTALQEEEMKKKRVEELKEEVKGLKPEPISWDDVVMAKTTKAKLFPDYDDEYGDVPATLSELESISTEEPAATPGGTLGETLDAFANVMYVANVAALSYAEGKTFTSEYDASFSRPFSGRTEVDEGVELTFERVGFWENECRIYVIMLTPSGENVWVSAREMDDYLPELSLVIDQAVAENSDYGSLAHMDRSAHEAFRYQKGAAKAAFLKTADAFVHATGKAKEDAKTSVENYYQRQTAFGII